jgi:hypothetical protein
MARPGYYYSASDFSTGQRIGGSKPMPGPRGASTPPGVKVTTPQGSTTTNARTPGSQPTDTTTTTTTQREKVVAYPNFGFYVSAADAYSTVNPADPRNSKWNIPMTKQDAIDMWDSGDFSPELQDYLNAVAKSQHPMKKGKTLWAEAVGASYAVSGRGETITPWSILSQKYLNPFSAAPAVAEASTGGGYDSYGGGGYGGGMGSVSLTDPTSARGLLLQTMQGVLGRNPSDKEYNQFIKALNQAEMNAPRTVSVEGDVAVQSGGVDPGMVAMEYVEGLEEFESAAGQRTFDAFMQVLGA